MEVIFDYKPYPRPKKAKYYETGNDYILDPKTGLCGWSKIEKEALVIGETDDSFITVLKEHVNSDTWEKDYGETCLLPLGFHKSRLINWIPSIGDQLRLFE